MSDVQLDLMAPSRHCSRAHLRDDGDRGGGRSKVDSNDCAHPCCLVETVWVCVCVQTETGSCKFPVREVVQLLAAARISCLRLLVQEELITSQLTSLALLAYTTLDSCIGVRLRSTVNISTTSDSGHAGSHCLHQSSPRPLDTVPHPSCRQRLAPHLEGQRRLRGGREARRRVDADGVSALLCPQEHTEGASCCAACSIEPRRSAG